MGNLEEHPFFKTVFKEHELLREWSRNLTNNTDSAYESLVALAESRHDRKEEEIWFKRLHENPKLSEGGPFCTLYFDFYVRYPPLEIAKKITGANPIPSAARSFFYQNYSQVRIPTDEHQSCEHILSFLKQNWTALTNDRRASIANEYNSLLLRHLDKEESCLKEVTKRLLQSSQLDQMLSDWLSFEMTR